MEDLSCYQSKIRAGLVASRRMDSMFGYTFSNLKHELQFMPNVLLGFDVGDLFLLAVTLHDLPLSEAAIRRHDPTLRGGMVQEFDPRSLAFFSGPLLRNRRSVREVKVVRDVQVPSVIPNSYAVGPIVPVYAPSPPPAPIKR